MKTYSAKKEDIKHEWYHLDAQGQVLGRLAVRVAHLLIGKGKSSYTPHVLSGDYVVVTNASAVRVTGNKMKEKLYDHYTGYPGGRRVFTMEQLFESKPEEVLLRAVRGMLPKNRLGEKMLTHLRIYPGKDHKQQAQKPVTLAR